MIEHLWGMQNYHLGGIYISSQGIYYADLFLMFMVVNQQDHNVNWFGGEIAYASLMFDPNRNDWIIVKCATLS